MGAPKGNTYARDSKKKRGPDKIKRNLRSRVVAVWDALDKAGKSLLVEAKKDPQWFYVNFIKPMLPRDVTVAGDADNPIEFKMSEGDIDNRIATILAAAAKPDK